MFRGWAWVGLCLSLTSIARAESGVAPIRVDVPTEIPSGGVLPIFGSCIDARCSNLQSVTVVDTASGARVEGHVELVQTTASYEGWAYFVPSMPFRSGAKYRVILAGGSPDSAPVVSIRPAEPTGLDESALRVTAILSQVREVSGRQCCSVSNCIDVSVVNSVELTATMSAERVAATQHLFELSMHAQSEQAGRAVLEFRPLRTEFAAISSTMRFDGASDSYCYTVRARSITGGDPFKLMTRCLANDYTGLGRQTRSPEEVAQWAATCERTPTPVDAGAPSVDLADASTTDPADASTDADGEPLGRGEESTRARAESGCRLAAGRTQVGSVMWWLFALVALARRGRASCAEGGRTA